jgi:hypothetical protein
MSWPVVPTPRETENPYSRTWLSVSNSGGCQDGSCEVQKGDLSFCQSGRRDEINDGEACTFSTTPVVHRVLHYCETFGTCCVVSTPSEPTGTSQEKQPPQFADRTEYQIYNTASKSTIFTYRRHSRKRKVSFRWVWVEVLECPRRP